MKEKFHTRCATFLDSSGYSMGALLFSMGDQRLVYDYSSLMYHNYSSMAWGKGDEMKAYVEHAEKNIHEFFHDIVAKQGFLTEEEFQEMLIGKDFWFDATQMAKRGIATHVIVEGYVLEADVYLKYKESDAAIEEFITKLLEDPEDKPTTEEEKPKKKAKAKAKAKKK